MGGFAALWCICLLFGKSLFAFRLLFLRSGNKRNRSKQSDRIFLSHRGVLLHVALDAADNLPALLQVLWSGIKHPSASLTHRKPSSPSQYAVPPQTR